MNRISLMMLTAMITCALAMFVARPACAEGVIGTSGGPNVSIEGCWYYEHADFKGRRGEIGRDGAQQFFANEWNDTISSVACSAGCHLRAWMERDFGGAAENFYPNTVYVGEQWDERISAIEAVCEW